MNTPEFTLSQADIEALVERARVERANALRDILGALPGAMRKLAAKLRPNSHRFPQAGIWA